MTIERLVGIYVSDDEVYQKYRDHMFPILQSYDGDFGYDFKISEVLKNEGKKPINRVFTIYFKTEVAMNSFFEDENYLEVREKYFTPSVTATTEIARYMR